MKKSQCVFLFSLLAAVVWIQVGVILSLKLAGWGVMSRDLWPHRWCHCVFFSEMMSNEVKCQGCRPDQRPHSLTAACDAESKAAINRHSQASDSFFSLPKWKQNSTPKQTTFGFVSLRKCSSHPVSFLSCTLASQPAAGRSRYCPLISPLPSMLQINS